MICSSGNRPAHAWRAACRRLGCLADALEAHRYVFEVEQIVGNGSVYGDPRLFAGEYGGRGQHPGAVGLGRQRQADGERQGGPFDDGFHGVGPVHGGQLEGDCAQFALTLGLVLGALFRRPAERHTQQFAAADFTGCFDHDAVLARFQRLEWRLPVGELQPVTAHGTGGTADTVDRHFQAAATASPPLAQVLSHFSPSLSLSLVSYHTARLATWPWSGRSSQMAT